MMTALATGHGSSSRCGRRGAAMRASRLAQMAPCRFTARAALPGQTIRPVIDRNHVRGLRTL